MNRTVLIVAIFLLSLGAFSLHSRIHPIMVESKTIQLLTTPKDKVFEFSHFLASLFCLTDLVLVTILFCSKKTVDIAFLLNGMIAIYGTILMGHFSIAQLWGTGASLADWLYLKSTLADIIILGADFLIGKAIYDSYMRDPAI